MSLSQHAAPRPELKFIVRRRSIVREIRNSQNLRREVTALLSNDCKGRPQNTCCTQGGEASLNNLGRSMRRKSHSERLLHERSRYHCQEEGKRNDKGNRYKGIQVAVNQLPVNNHRPMPEVPSIRNKPYVAHWLGRQKPANSRALPVCDQQGSPNYREKSIPTGKEAFLIQIEKCKAYTKEPSPRKYRSQFPGFHFWKPSHSNQRANPKLPPSRGQQIEGGRGLVENAKHTGDKGQHRESENPYSVA